MPGVTFSVAAYRLLAKGRLTGRPSKSVATQVARVIGVPATRAQFFLDQLHGLGLLRGERPGRRAFAWVELTEQPLALEKIMTFPPEDRALYAAQVLIATFAIDRSAMPDHEQMKGILVTQIDGIQEHLGLDFDAFALEVKDKAASYTRRG